MTATISVRHGAVTRLAPMASEPLAWFLNGVGPGTTERRSGTSWSLVTAPETGVDDVADLILKQAEW